MQMRDKMTGLMYISWILELVVRCHSSNLLESAALQLNLSSLYSDNCSSPGSNITQVINVYVQQIISVKQDT